MMMPEDTRKMHLKWHQPQVTATTCIRILGSLTTSSHSPHQHDGIKHLPVEDSLVGHHENEKFCSKQQSVPSSTTISRVQVLRPACLHCARTCVMEADATAIGLHSVSALAIRAATYS